MDAFQAELDGLVNPSAILNPLRTTGYDKIDESDLLRLKRALRVFAESQGPVDPAIFNPSLEEYFQLPPPQDVVVAAGETIEEPANLIFEEVIIDSQGIRIENLAQGWMEKTMTVNIPQRHELPPRYLAGQATFTTFKNNVRLISNVLYMLKVRGVRVIRGTTLIDLVRPRGNDGEITKASRELESHMHRIAVDELWADWVTLMRIRTK